MGKEVGVQAAGKIALVTGAARRVGKSIALFNYTRYGSDVRNQLDHRVRDYAWSNELPFITAGERARFGAIYVVSPHVFEHPMDRFPALDVDEIVVLGEYSVTADAAKANIVASFGREARWTSADEVASP